ncbi:hypothetical protein U1Q18_040535 [Sarracenia purpurea var. burkii]
MVERIGSIGDSGKIVSEKEVVSEQEQQYSGNMRVDKSNEEDRIAVEEGLDVPQDVVPAKVIEPQESVLAKVIPVQELIPDPVPEVEEEQVSEEDPIDVIAGNFDSPVVSSRGPPDKKSGSSKKKKKR